MTTVEFNEKVGIKDALVRDVVGMLWGHTGQSEASLMSHAILVLLVAKELTGIENIDDLFEQLSDAADRIISDLEGN